MGSELLAYASAFNTQKIAEEGSVNVTVGASIVSETTVTTIVTLLSSVNTFRLRVEYNGKIETLSDESVNGSGLSLAAYSTGSSITVTCSSSPGSTRNITIYYRVYLDA